MGHYDDSREREEEEREAASICRDRLQKRHDAGEESYYAYCNKVTQWLPNQGVHGYDIYKKGEFYDSKKEACQALIGEFKEEIASDLRSVKRWKKKIKNIKKIIKELK